MSKFLSSKQQTSNLLLNFQGADEEDNEPGEGDEDNEETVEEIVASNLQAGGTMSFEEAALAAHNRFRAKHRVGPLVLDRQVKNVTLFLKFNKQSMISEIIKVTPLSSF